MEMRPINQNKVWSEVDLNWLKINYKNFTYKEIANKLGRTELAIKIAIIINGWAESKPKWREDEIRILRNIYGNTSINEIIKRLGKSKYSILCKAYRLGIRKSR